MRRYASTPAQAMVEFALAATLIFFLLAAAVDLGLLFFTKQALTAAAQEGATFGSRWLADAPNGAAKLDIPEIQNRVRFESGLNGGNNVIRLTDLNSDGINDSSQSGIIDPNGTTGYIQVRSLADTNMDGNPTNDGGALCTDPSRSTVSCYVYVTVKKIHNMFFPLSGLLGSKITVSSSYYMLIRSSFRSNNSTNPPTFATPTVAPDLAYLIVDLSGIPTAFPSSQSSTNWKVSAYYDPNGGTTNGTGITRVFSKITFPKGEVRTNDDYGAPYNVFGSPGTFSNSDWTLINSSAAYKGNYILEVTAYATNGLSKTVTKTITR